MSDHLPPETPAEQLEQLVFRHLLGQCRIRNLRVLIQDERVVLRGQTDTYYAKQLAQHAVLDVTDLPILANEIEVRSDADPRRKPR
jgi:6-phosphogluconolactonase/glucosamine-6-phosphate isomerase/deaminase